MIVINRTRSRAKASGRLDNVPSPERIRQMTERIQKSWTPRERRRRSNTCAHVEVTEMPLQPRRKGYWDD